MSDNSAVRTAMPHQPYTKTTTTATPPLTRNVAGADAENLELTAIAALKARDVTSPEQFLEQATPDAILGACRWYDAQKGRVGTGLLVTCLREGGKPGYGQNEQRSLPITARLLQAVRGRCLSPDGCRRSEALDMFADAAKRRDADASELVDQAMGPAWELTPPHPAMLRLEGQAARYNALLSDGLRRPDATVVRGEGECLLAYSSRFWRVAA